MAGELPINWSEYVNTLVDRVNKKEENIASRKASQNSIEGLAPILPELIGGSADLAGSNLTLWSGSKVSAEKPGVIIFIMAYVNLA